MPQSDSSERGITDSQSDNSSVQDNQKGSSQPEFITVAQLKDILAQEREAQRRAEQSAKDKGIKAVTQRVDEIDGSVKQLLQRFSSEGKSASDVLTALNQQEAEQDKQLLREMALAFKEGRFPQAAPQGSEAKQEVDIAEVIGDFGLDMSDTRVAELASRSFETIEAAEAATVALIKRMNKRPAPSNAERASAEGGSHATATNEARLQAEYDEIVRTKKPRGQALINLKIQYRKKGLRSLS